MDQRWSSRPLIYARGRKQWILLGTSGFFSVVLFFPATVREGIALSKQTSVFWWICLSGPLVRWGKRIRLEDAPRGTHHPGLPGTTLGFSSECPSTPESFHPVLTGTVYHWPPHPVSCSTLESRWRDSQGSDSIRRCAREEGAFLSPQRALYLLAAKEKLGVGLYPVASAAGPGVGAGQETQTLGGESNICPTAQRRLKPRQALGALTCWQPQSISAPAGPRVR